MSKYNTIYRSALVLVFLFLSINSFAGNRSGTVAEQFLKIPTDARIVGLGGSFAAVAEGVSSLAQNPGGLMSIENIGFSATYTPWFANIQHSFIGAAIRMEDFGVFGAGITMLATDDMAVTTVHYPEGNGQYFRAADYAMHLAYARNISDKFSVGIAGKYIYSSLYNNVVTASSFAFDIGSMYDMPEIRTRLGVALTNLGDDVQFLNEPYSLPTALRFGAALTLFQENETQLLSTVQVARPNDADEQYNAGFEYTVNETFTLRGGYKFAYEVEDFTGGFGVGLHSIGFNGTLQYGYNNFKVLPGTHTVTFEMNF
jgi:hypothetical protein